VVAQVVREAVEILRNRMKTSSGEDLSDRQSVLDRVVQLTLERIEKKHRKRYCRVLNATGIILHTGLGRAVLSPKSLHQIATEMAGYSHLQLDLNSGNRCKRDDRIEALLQMLTDCQAATVVNNNAAATMIVLNAVAEGREVIVSRGQLVEIGGSFRLPEIMERSGVKLVEVGTTNKTHPHDYENAVTEQTAAILRVHPSNYRISGFTSEVPLETLVKIARKRKIAIIDDVGAGSLIDVSLFGFEKEPTLQESVRQGADLITSSADKLIGASQGGLILGKEELVAKIRKNPLARIVRPDKLTLAVLEATLEEFLAPDRVAETIPTIEMMCRKPEHLAEMAESIASALREKIGRNAMVETLTGYSQMGSGSLPTQNLPTHLVAVTPRTLSPDTMAKKLRTHHQPVFARIGDQKVLFDPRTLRPGEERLLMEVVADVLSP
jgi:L-seryl-tRNA(Ser) seleniumtransferase